MKISLVLAISMLAFETVLTKPTSTKKTSTSVNTSTSTKKASTSSVKTSSIKFSTLQTSTKKTTSSSSSSKPSSTKKTSSSKITSSSVKSSTLTTKVSSTSASSSTLLSTSSAAPSTSSSLIVPSTSTASSSTSSSLVLPSTTVEPLSSISPSPSVPLSTDLATSTSVAPLCSPTARFIAVEDPGFGLGLEYWHLESVPSGIYADSPPNNNDGTTYDVNGPAFLFQITNTSPAVYTFKLYQDICIKAGDLHEYGWYQGLAHDRVNHPDTGCTVNLFQNDIEISGPRAPCGGPTATYSQESYGSCDIPGNSDGDDTQELYEQVIGQFTPQTNQVRLNFRITCTSTGAVNQYALGLIDYAYVFNIS